MPSHTLTFSDWNNYVDGNGNSHTLDWSSPAAMAGQFLYPYVEALRQAANERLAVRFPWRLDAAIEAASSGYDLKWTVMALDQIRAFLVFQDIFAEILYGLPTRAAPHMIWTNSIRLPSLHNEQQFLTKEGEKHYSHVSVLTEVYTGFRALASDAGVSSDMVDNMLKGWSTSISIPFFPGEPAWNYLPGPVSSSGLTSTLFSMKRMLALMLHAIPSVGPLILEWATPTDDPINTYQPDPGYRWILPAVYPPVEQPSPGWGTKWRERWGGETFGEFKNSFDNQPWSDIGQARIPGGFFPQYIDAGPIHWLLAHQDLPLFQAVRSKRDHEFKIELPCGCDRDIAACLRHMTGGSWFFENNDYPAVSDEENRLSLFRTDSLSAGSIVSITNVGNDWDTLTATPLDNSWVHIYHVPGVVYRLRFDVPGGFVFQ